MYRIKKELKKFKILRLGYKNFKKKYWSINDDLFEKYLRLKKLPFIKTHYARLNNFGDQYNKDLLNFFGYKLVYAKGWKESDVALTGSILQHYPPDFKGRILGTGFIDSKYSRKNVLWNTKILRGPLTAKQCGQIDDPVVYGDPGILASLVFSQDKIKKYLLGIVPHYVDYDYAYKLFKNSTDVNIINVRQSASKVAKEIQSCEYIASSSLHGLIFADSFRIPNIHLKFGDLLFGNLHKFNDYYLGMESEPQCVDYHEEMKIDEIISFCKLRHSEDYLSEKQNKIKNIISEELKDLKND